MGTFDFVAILTILALAMLADTLRAWGSWKTALVIGCLLVIASLVTVGISTMLPGHGAQGTTAFGVGMIGTLIGMIGLGFCMLGVIIWWQSK